MKVPRLKKWRGVAAAAAVIACTAGTTLGVTTLLGVTFPKDTPEEAGAEVEATPAGDQVVFCIDTFSSQLPAGPQEALEQLALTQIDLALESVKLHPYWVPSGLASKGDPIVTIGCPSPPLPSVTGPETQWIGGDHFGALPPTVETESSVDVFVFIMPSAEMDYLLGGTSSRGVAQELKCSGHVCDEITHALYLTPEEIQAGGRALANYLEQMVGLRE